MIEGREGTERKGKGVIKMTFVKELFGGRMVRSRVPDVDTTGRILPSNIIETIVNKLFVIT